MKGRSPWKKADDRNPSDDVVRQILPERIGFAGLGSSVHGFDRLERDAEEEPRHNLDYALFDLDEEVVVDAPGVEAEHWDFESSCQRRRHLDDDVVGLPPLHVNHSLP